MVTNLIRPSYQNNFYTPQRGGMPAFPNLWKNLILALVPALGNSGIITLPDVSVFKNDGTLNGTNVASNWVESTNPIFQGHSLSFNDSDNNIAPSSALLPDLTQGSIAMWIKFNDLSGSGYLFDLETPRIVAWSDTSSTKLSFYASSTFTSNGDLNTTDWWHIVCTWDDIGDAVAIYFNGALDNSDTGVSTTSTPSGNFLIGARNSDAFHLGGEISSFLMYNRLLTLSEIKHLYTDQHSLFRTKQFVGKAPVVAGVSVGRLINSGLVNSGLIGGRLV